MPQVLLYNITDREKLVKIKLTLFRLGIPCREIAPEEYAHPLGYLLGREGYAPAAGNPEGSFTAEMLLMDDLRGAMLDRFLDELRAARATVVSRAGSMGRRDLWPPSTMWPGPRCGSTGNWSGSIWP